MATRRTYTHAVSEIIKFRRKFMLFALLDFNKVLGNPGEKICKPRCHFIANAQHNRKNIYIPKISSPRYWRIAHYFFRMFVIEYEFLSEGRVNGAGAAPQPHVT
ncbi:hypothetical protein RIR_jg7562.t1 [Rhizophagus irregularis DAOM 181602=DAOM 197198]|uniref:Uncharacterized protein n=1 Tax=Rhizophagus irregularis (strain DAOM 197198w) TaxID=1432141 RepID=A0A015MAG4_RHIIW|nr:hypothetical protein RirG_148600 [Rhizophagus irregularis DAOM 197198w]GBC40052.1 hypothetical protein RIR_jg7562.t1 [Rhizophagus irregularis DAOM 181602=DAOM 197198]